MDVMEKIKGRIFMDEIANAIFEGNEEKEKKGFIDSYQENIICYFLWKMKTNPKFKTVADFNKYFDDNVRDKFAPLEVDDAINFFMENTDGWKRFRGLLDNYSSEELSAYILHAPMKERLFKKYNIPLNRLPEEIPQSLCDFIDELLDIKPKEKIKEINCEEGRFILESQKKHPKSKYCGGDESYAVLENAFVKAEILGLTSIEFLEDDYTDDVDFGSYDKAFGNAAINPNDTENVYIQGKRGKDIFPDKWTDFPMELSTAWNSCAGAFLSIKESGKAVAVMNSGQLTIKQTEAARKYMCDKGCIEGVIILPDKMYTNTWVNPFIVILSYNNNSIRFYDARNECVCGRINGKRQNRFSEENIQRIIEDYHSDDKTAVIQMEVVAKNNYNLNPLLYVTTDISEKTISLKDVLLEVKRGISISAAEMDDNISEEESKEKCIIPSSISGGVVDSKYYYHAEIKKPGKNNASVGDVLLSKTGNPFKIAISRDHYLVIGNIYILQIDKEKISPEYIRCFLSSKQGQKEIAKYAVGSATPVISIANLQKIQIPIFEEKKQKDIEKKAKEVLEEIETCYQQILDDKYEIDSMFS